MNEKTKRTLLGCCLIFLGIGLAYSGLLILGILMGTVATVVIAFDDFKLFGEEEESNEEES